MISSSISKLLRMLSSSRSFLDSSFEFDFQRISYEKKMFSKTFNYFSKLESAKLLLNCYIKDSYIDLFLSALSLETNLIMWNQVTSNKLCYERDMLIVTNPTSTRASPLSNRSKKSIWKILETSSRA